MDDEVEVTMVDVWGNDEPYWYYSTTAVAIKWSILAAFVFLIVGFFVSGYMHAQRRTRKNLPLLAYHRWFIPRRARSQVWDQPSQQPSQPPYHQAQVDGYNLESVPPPAYNPNSAPPPAYYPPVGASKAQPPQQPPSGQISSSAPANPPPAP